jgi:hypothetical protein
VYVGRLGSLSLCLVCKKSLYIILALSFDSYSVDSSLPFVFNRFDSI